MMLNLAMLGQFKKNRGGSITLYIQINSPVKEKESNRLPAPDGPFYCVPRLYGPQELALSGERVNYPLWENYR